MQVGPQELGDKVTIPSVSSRNGHCTLELCDSHVLEWRYEYVTQADDLERVNPVRVSQVYRSPTFS